MSALSIQVPFPVFNDRDGQPLDNGYVWIGVTNLPPQTNPVNVYFDEALTILAPQPLRTINGYISRAGSPAQVYIDGVNFSILVQDSKGSMVYNFPEGTGIDPNASGVAFTGFKGQVGFVSDLADDDGSDWIGFEPAGAGAVAQSAQDKMREIVSVLDFGADPTGVADSTAAFNLATNSAYTSTGNFDQNFPGGVYVPPGIYKITDTVYVHKGQHLYGAGSGSKINATGMLGGSVPVFKLGHSATAQDAGALAPEISALFTEGGPNAAVIECKVAGAFAHDLFISGPGIAFALGAADTVIVNNIIDVGLNGFVITGQNHIIDSCLFFNQNYPIQVQSNTFDVQINNCIFEYTKFDDILFENGGTNIQGITIQNCKFLKNEQFVTSDQAIQIRCAGASITIHGCEFRNQRGFSITNPTGVANTVRVSNCVFNGAKTNPGYAQSSTAAGVKAENSFFEITNCTFINLFGNPVEIATTAANVPTVVKDCSYRNITTATQFVTITATLGDITITGCVGDNVLPLVNLQSAIVPRLKNNTRWLGASGTSGGRFFWKIPTTGAALVNVGISSNAVPLGSLNYRDASSIYAARSIDFDVVEQDVAAKYTIYETPGNVLVGPLDIQVDLDSVGGGSTSPYTAQGRYLVVSVPDTYLYTEIEADFVI